MGKQLSGPELRSERNAAWIERYCRVPEGRLVGRPIRLTGHQRRWLAQIYDTPTRRFILSMGRKNAKTTFCALLLLLHIAGPEAKPNSQLFSAAQSLDQASVLFSLAAKIVRMSPDLSAYVTVRDTRKQLFCAELGVLYRALSAEASTAYGLSPALVIHDELGQVRGPRSELYEALETASGAQEEPLSIIISTQAPTDGDLLSVLIDDAKAGRNVRVKLALYTAPEEDDPFEEATIRKANPHFDDFMNREEVLDQADDARRMPSREASYRNLILNQRVQMTNPFLTRAVWEKCAGEVDESIFDYADVFLALDLSSRADLTSLTAVARDEDGVFHVKSLFFTPLVGLRERSKRDRVPYDLWVEQGFLIATPGATVDYEVVTDHLLALAERGTIRKVAFDRWRMGELQSCLSRREAELPLEPFGQGYVSMSPALDALEAEILNVRIRHGGHPVLRMCAANAVVTRSAGSGDRKLDKAKATGRIDGMVTLTMAVGVAVRELSQGGFDISNYLDPLKVSLGVRP